MNIGLGLPAAIPGGKGELLLEWARRADSAAFSSLGVLDRVDTPDWLWRDMNTCAWSVPWPDWLALNRCEKTLQVWLILGLKAKERPALPGPGLCVLAQIPIPAANALGL